MINLLLFEKKLAKNINENNSSAPDSAGLTIVRAVMCEGIQDFKPWNQAVVLLLLILSLKQHLP